MESLAMASRICHTASDEIRRLVTFRAALRLTAVNVVRHIVPDAADSRANKITRKGEKPAVKRAPSEDILIGVLGGRLA
jgi:hypothetical protein